jgi:rRNA biogenesis protein RRP5
MEDATTIPDGMEGLEVGGFDWTGQSLDKRFRDDADSSSGESSAESRKKKKRRKAEIKQDLTASLASDNAQSATDFERLLLGDPNESTLWIQYMAFYLQLSEVDKAREIARRAVKTIAQKEDRERFNVWIAMLNMESAYGDDDTLEETFKEACQYCDAQEVHERLASIYIQSGKTEVCLNISTPPSLCLV